MDMLAFLTATARQGFDEARLRAELVRRLVPLWEMVPRNRHVPSRLRERVARVGRLDGMDLDSVLTELWRLFEGNDAARPVLMELDAIAAQLGATACTLRLGQHVVAALRSAQPPGPWDDPEQVRRLGAELRAHKG